jgi:uncharacterized protein with FMN-binding domain
VAEVYNCRMALGGSKQKISNGLVTASCTAVLAVYIAGYSRTQSAANRLAAQVAERRVTVRLQSVPASLLPPAPKAPEVQRAPATSQESIPPPNKVPERVPEAPPEPLQQSAPVAVPEALPAAAPAPPPVEAKTELPPPPAPAPKWKDGTYTGWGFSRHGNIEAEVVIDGGRIASATISQCRTRYSCSVIEKLPPQVAERQSPEVDYVSGATQSADAFYGAVVAALEKAK